MTYEFYLIKNILIQIIIFIAFAFFTSKKPKYTISAFICLLPLLGQHPTYPNNTIFFVILLSLIVGLIFYKNSAILHITPFVIISILFLFMCALSILPYAYELINFLYYFYSPSQWIQQIIDSPAEKNLITIRNIFTYIMWITFILLLIKKEIIKKITYSIPYFFCISITFYNLIGLLDFFNIINLDNIRPITFPSEHRLQSIFWHPAWSAEYSSMIIPFFIVFLKNKKSKIKFYFYLIMLWLNIVSIILTFQRGGLVAVISLFILWVLFEIKIKKESMLIITSALVVFLILSIITVYKLEPNLFKQKFINKLLENNRTWYWSTALDMYQQSPLLGLGLDSYGWRYLYFRPIGNQGYVYLHGTAHNQYFQFLAGIGTFGLLSYLLLYLYCLINSYKNFKKSLSPIDLAIFLAISIFGIYSLYQEMFYNLCIGTLFWLVVTLMHINSYYKIQHLSSSYIKLILIIVIIQLIFFQSILAAIEKKSLEYTKITEGYGLYAQEIWNNHYYVYWIGKRAYLPITHNYKYIYLIAMHPNILKNPVITKIYYKNHLYKIIEWNKSSWQKLDLINILKDHHSPKILYITVNRTWIPKKYGGLDYRSLGVAIGIEKKGMIE